MVRFAHSLGLDALCISKKAADPVTDVTTITRQPSHVNEPQDAPNSATNLAPLPRKLMPHAPYVALHAVTGVQQPVPASQRAH